MYVRVSNRKNKIEQSKPDYKNKWILIKSLFFKRAKKSNEWKTAKKSTEESIKVNERKLALTLTANLVEC